MNLRTLLSGSIQLQPAATALTKARTAAMAIAGLSESTRKGAAKAAMRATLFAREWPVERMAVGNSSGVATHVAHDAAWQQAERTERKPESSEPMFEGGNVNE